MKIGFIGQGWIGKHYADDFQRRRYQVVRYALEEPYIHNKDKLNTCDIIFIAVPTPTTTDGFDDSHVKDALRAIPEGVTAVIKSTILPGTTEKLQQQFSKLIILNSPEFLVEKTAKEDASHPKRNIIGIPVQSDTYRQKAQCVMDVLPKAPYECIIPSLDAEIVKYAGNCFLYTKVVYINLLYDLVSALGGNFNSVRDALIRDERIGISHTEPVYDSGRGAGGDCFIKDFEAFSSLFRTSVGDVNGDAVLSAIKEKNIELLRTSGKDLTLVNDVYGDSP